MLVSNKRINQCTRPNIRLIVVVYNDLYTPGIALNMLLTISHAILKPIATNSLYHLHKLAFINSWQRVVQLQSLCTESWWILNSI